MQPKAYISIQLNGSPLLVSAVFVISTVAMAVLQLPVTRLQRGRRRTRALALSLCIYAVSFAAFLAAPYLASGTAMTAAVVIGTLVYTLASRAGDPPLSALQISIPPPELRGRYVMTYSLLCGALTAALAPVTFASLLGLGPLVLWGTLILGVLIAACAYLRLERQLPREVVNPA